MQKIVLFIEPQKEKYDTPLKIGNLFMNRFAIDEDGCHGILKIYYLQNSVQDYKNGRLTEHEGPDHIEINYEMLSFKLIPFVLFFF